jgi:hypothetical protein
MHRRLDRFLAFTLDRYVKNPTGASQKTPLTFLIFPLEGSTLGRPASPFSQVFSATWVGDELAKRSVSIRDDPKVSRRGHRLQQRRTLVVASA